LQYFLAKNFLGLQHSLTKNFQSDLKHKYLYDANDNSVNLRKSSRLKSKARKIQKSENQNRRQFEDLDVLDEEDDVKDQDLSFQKIFNKNENCESNFAGERICPSKNRQEKQIDQNHNCPKWSWRSVRFSK
jgi:hypothetical protein